MGIAWRLTLGGNKAPDGELQGGGPGTWIALWRAPGGRLSYG
jgi:hypothetical protein